MDPLAEQHEAERKWLEALKTGDQVIVGRSWNESLEKVTHCTSTQIHVGDSKYRRKDGTYIGDHHGSLRMPTPAAVESIEREKLVNRIVNMMQRENVKRMNIEKLRRIAAIIDQPKSAE